MASENPTQPDCGLRWATFEGDNHRPTTHRCGLDPDHPGDHRCLADGCVAVRPAAT